MARISGPAGLLTFSSLSRAGYHGDLMMWDQTADRCAEHVVTNTQRGEAGCKI